jgi:hypothetical protein
MMECRNAGMQEFTYYPVTLSPCYLVTNNHFLMTNDQ